MQSFDFNGGLIVPRSRGVGRWRAPEPFEGTIDPPPMKWSALWYGFEPGGRIDVEEATQA